MNKVSQVFQADVLTESEPDSSEESCESVNSSDSEFVLEEALPRSQVPSLSEVQSVSGSCQRSTAPSQTDVSLLVNLLPGQKPLPVAEAAESPERCRSFELRRINPAQAKIRTEKHLAALPFNSSNFTNSSSSNSSSSNPVGLSASGGSLDRLCTSETVQIVLGEPTPKAPIKRHLPVIITARPKSSGANSFGDFNLNPKYEEDFLLKQR